MKWLKTITLGTLLLIGDVTFGSIAVTQTNQNRAVTQINYLKKLPPLIDREVFFSNPEIADAKISPDGKFLAFQKPVNGLMNVWVKRVDQPFTSARAVTNITDSPIRTYFWSRDGKYILYVKDQGGNENFHIYAVTPTTVAGKSAPPARDLTPLENVRALITALPEKTPNRIIVGLNDRNPQLFDVYQIDLSTGKRKLMLKNEQNVLRWIADLDGNIRLGLRPTANGGMEILRVDNNKSLVPVYSCSVEETCEVIRFHKDGKRAYLKTNQGNVNLTRLVLFNPQTQQSEVVSVDPKQEVDFSEAIFSEATEELIATVYEGDRLRIYPQTKEFARDLAFLQKSLPDGDLNIEPGTNDDRLYLISLRSDVIPGTKYLFDRKTRQVTKLYDLRPDLPSKNLAPMRPLRYAARDGLQIPAYLTIPKGAEPRNLPVVVMPHGGPWARDFWGYNPFIQFLANRGYAVFQPNFRGSAGFGKAFLNAGNKQWGTGAMQHDITDGVKYLIAQKIVDPKRVGIHGVSYGGYATLAGLAFTPELYAAGISYVGPSNILTLLNAIPPYWEPFRPMLAVRVGNPKDPKDLARLRQQSPLFSAKQIKAPLLVIQGANDPRVKKAESDQIVVALRDLGRNVEYLVAPNEGHGFRREDNKLAVTAAMERFLALHLGGREQTSLSPQIKARLEALTINVDSVTAPESPSATKKQ